MSSQNYSLDFSGKMPPAVQDKVRDGMKRADQNANYFWKKILDGCVLAAARRLSELTVDDVLDELDAINTQRKLSKKAPIETHNMDALGPAMSRARKDGVISPTDRVKRSQRAEKHGNRHNVWLSNFYSPSPRGENSSGTTAGSSGIPEQSIPVLPSKAGAAGELPETSLVPTVPYKGGILA